MVYYQDSHLRQDPTDPSKVRVLCTFYLQRQPALVAERNRLISYSVQKQWVNADEALSFCIDLSKIAEVRRGAFAGGTGVATYKRPDSVKDNQQFADSLEVSFNQERNGRLVLTNARHVPARVGDNYKKTRLHTTAGDLPAKLLEAVLNKADSPLDVLLAARDYFDKVAACRALGATNALSHPILIWKDEASGDYHWYARGYDAICFSLFGNALSSFDSEGAAYASPLLVDCAPYSPYEGLQYDVSFVCRASEAELSSNTFSTTGAKVNDVVRGALAIGMDVLNEFGAYTRAAAGVAHREMIDPYGLTTSDCADIVKNYSRLSAATLPDNAEELAERILSEDIAVDDLDLSQEESHGDAVDIAAASEQLKLAIARKFDRSVESLQGWYLRLKGGIKSGLANAWGSAKRGVSERIEKTILLTAQWIEGDPELASSNIDSRGYVASVAYDPNEEAPHEGSREHGGNFKLGVNRVVRG